MRPPEDLPQASLMKPSGGHLAMPPTGDPTNAPRGSPKALKGHPAKSPQDNPAKPTWLDLKVGLRLQQRPHTLPNFASGHW
jgi:hypothetical protein